MTVSNKVDGQRALRALNLYHGKIDGNWGVKSRAAAEKFAVQAGIPKHSFWTPRLAVHLSAALFGLEHGKKKPAGEAG